MGQEWFLRVVLEDIDTEISAQYKRIIIRILNSLNPKPVFCEQITFDAVELIYKLNLSSPFEAQVEADEIIEKVIDPLLEKRQNLKLNKFTIHQGAIPTKESY